MDVAVLLIMALDEIDDWYCSALLHLQALRPEPHRQEDACAMATHYGFHVEGAESVAGTGQSFRAK